MNRAIIYEEQGADPARDRIVSKHGDGRTTIIAVPDPLAALRVAAELAQAGVDRIDLCGGFGPLWRAKAIDAVAGRIPVGAVLFGFESLTGVADYKKRFESGEAMSAAFIHLESGADPGDGRTVRTDAQGNRSTFVAAPTARAAAKMAIELVDGGAQLIELYGFGPSSAAEVIDAVGGRAPVGVATPW